MMKRTRSIGTWAGLACLVACAGAAPQAAEGRRNVLFIAVDDLNNDLGCYGHPLVRSPHVDRLAKRGVRFDRAYCQYPVCNPSRSSFLTGRYPEKTGVLSNAGDLRKALPDAVTLPQHFTKHGYFAARVGKLFHYGVPNQIGTDGADDKASWQKVVNPRGVDREVHDKIHTLEPGQFGGTLSWLKMETRDEEHTDGIGARAAVGLMEENHPAKTGKPFFLAVGFYRPHTPYVAPARWFDLYPLDKIQPEMERPGDRDDMPAPALRDRKGQRELTVEKRREIIQAYYASISHMDAQVGVLLDALDRLKLAENTVVVFVSDHGYHLGHKGLWQKGDLFEGSARVPLIVAAPGMKSAGRGTSAVTELVDLYPTLAELCGLPAPGTPGTSLRPVLDDPSLPGKESAYTVTSVRGGLGRTVRTARHRYTEWGDGGKDGVELYDYEKDPDEVTNLAKDAAHAKTLEAMKALLARARERAAR